jgi:membrane protein
MTLRAIGHVLKDAGKKFLADEAPRLGAALAFYTALSLSPLLLAVVALAGFIFGEKAARGELVEQLRDTIGQEAATVVEQLVAKSATGSGGVVASVVALVIVIYGASRVFTELQGALNTVWKVPGRKPERGIWNWIKGRLLSFSLVAGTAFLLIVSLVVSAILSSVNEAVTGWLPGMDALAQVANFLLTLLLLILLFAMIFQWLPETDLAWSDVWVGATATALLFSIGKYLIGLYLGKAAVGSAYGAAGAFVVLLVWVYYSTQIVLFGAEITYVYAKRFGHGFGDAPAPLAGTELQSAV